MRIFDRKFMQYQLAYGTWYNLTSRFLFMGMIFAVITFFSDSITYLLAIPVLYFYGYVRLQYLLNASDDVYQKRMEKQYTYYEKKNEKAQGKAAFQLEKILFAVELDKKSATEAIDDVKAVLKVRPKLRRFIDGMMLSLYLVDQEEKKQQDIPQHLIENMYNVLEKEENPNALVDYVRMALRLEKYDLAIQLIDQAEDKKKVYKRQRLPVYRSIYKTLQVSLPYYRAIAYFKMGEQEKANEEFNIALKRAQSKKLKKQMQIEAEGMGMI